MRLVANSNMLAAVATLPSPLPALGLDRQHGHPMRRGEGRIPVDRVPRKAVVDSVQHAADLTSANQRKYDRRLLRRGLDRPPPAHRLSSSTACTQPALIL